MNLVYLCFQAPLFILFLGILQWHQPVPVHCRNLHRSCSLYPILQRHVTVLFISMTEGVLKWSTMNIELLVLWHSVPFHPHITFYLLHDVEKYLHSTLLDGLQGGCLTFIVLPHFSIQGPVTKSTSIISIIHYGLNILSLIYCTCLSNAQTSCIGPACFAYAHIPLFGEHHCHIHLLLKCALCP